MREGVPPLWSLISFIAGVGIVAALVTFAGLAAAWIVAAFLGGLFVIAAAGGYRVWGSAIAASEIAERELERRLDSIRYALIFNTLDVQDREQPPGVHVGIQLMNLGTDALEI